MQWNTIAWEDVAKLWTGNVWVCVNNNVIRGRKKKNNRETLISRLHAKTFEKLVGLFCSSLFFLFQSCETTVSGTGRPTAIFFFFAEWSRLQRFPPSWCICCLPSVQIAAYFKYNCVSQSESQSALGNVSLGASPTGSQSKYCQHLPGRAGSVSATSPQFKLY